MDLGRNGEDEFQTSACRRAFYWSAVPDSADSAKRQRRTGGYSKRWRECLDAAHRRHKQLGSDSTRHNAGRIRTGFEPPLARSTCGLARGDAARVSLQRSCRRESNEGDADLDGCEVTMLGAQTSCLQ